MPLPTGSCAFIRSFPSLPVLPVHGHGMSDLRQAVAGVVLVAMTIGCGGDGGSTGVDRPPVVLTTLVGTWDGSVSGDPPPNGYGYAVMRTTLAADSSMRMEPVGASAYCAVSGTWSFAASRVTATARDCDGIVITFGGDLTGSRVNGDWSATSGKVGTFTMSKRP